MRTLLLLSSILILAAAAAPGLAQTKGAARTTLKTLIKQAKNDPQQLFEAAEFAKKNELSKDADQLLEKVLKLSPNHEGANLAIGNLRHEGKWYPAAQAEKLQNESKGLVEVGGIWVEKDQVADAQRGIYHHGDEVVNRWEKQQFLQGKVRHPKTGRFIASADLAKAGQDQFPISETLWVDLAKADEHHANPERPWVVRSTYCTILSTLPLDTIITKVLPELDSTYRRLIPILGGKDPHPKDRPVVRIAATQDEYTRLGDLMGGPGSAYGAFPADGAEIKLDGRRGQFAVSMWDKNWGPYWARHAAGLAIAASLCGDSWESLPLWFRRGIGGYVERHFNSRDAKFFGDSHKDKGGIRGLATFLENFEISGDLPASGMGSNDYNVFQAGLVFSFSMNGGDSATLEAMQKVSAAVPTGGATLKSAVAELQKVLAKKETEVKAFLEKTTSG